MIWILWAWDVLLYKGCGGGVLKQRLVLYTMDVLKLVCYGFDFSDGNPTLANCVLSMQPEALFTRVCR